MYARRYRGGGCCLVSLLLLPIRLILLPFVILFRMITPRRRFRRFGRWNRRGWI